MKDFVLQPLNLGGWLIITGIRLFAGIANALLAMGLIVQAGLQSANTAAMTALLGIGLIYLIVALFFYFKRYKYFKTAYIGLEIFFILFNYIVFPAIGFAFLVWSFVWILYMLLSKRVGQTFVYDWDGIVDRSRMEKAYPAKENNAGILNIRPETGDAALPGGLPEKGGSPHAGLETERKAAKKPLAWFYSVAAIVLAAAVILYVSQGKSPEAAAAVAPVQNTYETAEPEEVAEPVTIPAETMEQIAAEVPSGESLIETDNGMLNYDQLKKNFNAMPYAKKNYITMGEYYLNFNPDTIESFKSVLDRDGDFFYSYLTGIKDCYVAGFANADKTINAMVFFCYEESQNGEIEGLPLSLDFIMATNPEITKEDLDNLEMETEYFLELYGAQYGMKRITSDGEAPYYITAVIFGTEQ